MANSRGFGVLCGSVVGTALMATCGCERWTGEDGAGKLVFSAPVINSQVGGGLTDLITIWRFED